MASRSERSRLCRTGSILRYDISPSVALWVHADSIRSGNSFHLSYRLWRKFCLRHFHGRARRSDHPEYHRPIIPISKGMARVIFANFAQFTKSRIFSNLPQKTFNKLTLSGIRTNSRNPKIVAARFGQSAHLYDIVGAARGWLFIELSSCHGGNYNFSRF